MEIAWIMGGLFIFFTMIYVVLAVFLPEWVGITGKKAMKINEAHQDQTEGDSPTDKKKNP